MRWPHWSLVASACCLLACAPTMDWREVRPEGTDLLVLFPCKPSTYSRKVLLGAQRVEMRMGACQAGGATFVISRTDVVDPAQVRPALAALRVANAGNVDGSVQEEAQLTVPGMAPSDQSGRIRVYGRLPDGSATHIAIASFVRGTQIFQASVVAPRLEDGVVETFFSSLKFGG